MNGNDTVQLVAVLAWPVLIGGGFIALIVRQEICKFKNRAR